MFFAPIDSVRHLLADLMELLIILIIVEAVVSNLITFGMRISPYSPFVKALRAVVNPVLNPVRRILPPPYKTGGWDFSPLLVIFVLQILRSWLF